jgi:transposase
LDLELSELVRLRTQHDEVEKKLRELATEDKRVQLLETIPGVGRRTAEVVVAGLDDPRRFTHARQVSS